MFDARKFLTEEIGQAQSVHAMFSSAGYVLSLAAVKKWYQRSTIPGDWLALLLALMERERGAPVSLTEYFP